MRYKHEARKARGLAPFDALGVSWLDFKLGGRMLVRYPGLTIVGGLAAAFAIAVGACVFEFATQTLYPALPFPDADRLVAVRLWDPARLREERRVTRELAVWRSLRTVRDLGAFRATERNLVGDGVATGEPVVVAELDASAFRVTRAVPALGRLLVDADAAPGAAPVAVISDALWRSRFGADPHVVGRAVRLGERAATVVGVTTPGYGFPLYHDVCVPFPAEVPNSDRSPGPEVLRVFGRLAPGATIEAARAELATVTARAAAELAPSHARMRPRVDTFADAVSAPLLVGDALAVIGLQLFLVALVVLVFGNVALLVFARAATRESELVARSALGATRARIVTQLFAEALVLGGLGAAGGLAVAAAVVRATFRQMESEGARLSFWMHASLAPRTVLCAVALTLLGAAVSGALPGLKITRGLHSRLRQAAAGAGGVRLGGVWTTIIVAQVAVTVAFPVTAFFARRDAEQVRTFDPGLPTRQYLVARLEMEREAVPGVRGDTSADALVRRARLAAAALERRAEAEPGVVGVTFASLLPGMDHPQRRVEVDPSPSAGRRGTTPDSADAPRVSSVDAAPDWFALTGAPALAGRPLAAGDEGTRAVVVNAAFVRHVLRGGAAVGRRLRYLDPADEDAPRPSGWKASEWYAIVGVVPDLGMSDGTDPHESGAGIYHAVAPGPATFVAVRVAGDPRAFGPRLRELAAGVDPTLRLHDVQAMDEIPVAGLRERTFLYRALAGVSALALLLSLTGIYTVMALTVSRRTREIGVRVALGSDRRRIVAAIFRRPLTQVGVGVVAGAGLVALLVRGVLGPLTATEIALVAGYAALMMGVCLLACVVPTRRALGVEPTVALRAE